ncbi:MAG: hypothetical protein ACK40C_09840 [Novosphingobium meiothermophilum]
MRYNPWIEVNSAGQAARRKAYSTGRLRDPINRQFIRLQAQDVCISSQPACRAGQAAFFLPDFAGFARHGAPRKSSTKVAPQER